MWKKISILPLLILVFLAQGCSPKVLTRKELKELQKCFTERKYEFSRARKKATPEKIALLCADDFGYTEAQLKKTSEQYDQIMFGE